MTSFPFFNRELSWLAFNARVLQQAEDPRTPLLERLRFLGIFNSNLDEFFMKRVGGLTRLLLAQVSAASQIQLAEIRKAILPLLERHGQCLQRELLPQLAKKDIRLLRWNELNPEERLYATQFFERNVFPVLTPLAVDPGHPFPFISNLSTSLGVLLKHPTQSEEHLFARVKIPDVFPSWIRVNPGARNRVTHFVSLLDMIEQNLGVLFPGLEIQGLMAFRITRNADIERDEEDADDLLEMITEELRERRFAKVVRLEHGPRKSEKLLQLVMEELEIGPSDVYELSLDLQYWDLSPVPDLNRPSLKFPVWVPTTPLHLGDKDSDIFSIIRNGDLLVHHPYESFSASVERFIKAAVDDPKVLAIKMCLYRTGEDSPFIPLLIRAAEKGKQVVCLVELKARFDEEQNILVAQALEKAGVHVVYGIIGLKTHCKVSLVVRQEAEGMRCYAHFGTGNYHAGTARLYTDLGLFTAKPEFTEDLVHLFHYLTGLSLYRDYRKITVAPLQMKGAFQHLIEREIEHATQGRPARIIAKMNSLEDESICRHLYLASQAGVQIELIVRGFCCLKPGVPGLSENIRVISVIGRFLEHSRIFYFRNNSPEDQPLLGDLFISSADWMYRNLANRVETLVPIEEPALKQRCHEILAIMLNDRRQAWDLRADGTYVLRQPQEPPQDSRDLGTHATLMSLTRERNAPNPL